ncbi:MAG TPA: 2Fe-2S iron-sulfur cluster-binding protein, partial [Aggregatilineaceae bacterium]|nr:2Fe-2S iron-sulfur cluster-binding protein [Aggregatilineaceae bacterium]
MAEIVFQPFGRRVPARPGDNLLEAAQAGGITLSAVCGGVGVCGDCRVKVLRGAVSPINLTEQEFLSASEQAHGLRLACQTEILADGEILVDVPPDSLSTPQRIQITGKELGLAAVPAVQSHDLTGQPPSSDDLRGDWERLDNIHPADWAISAPALAELPGTLRANHWQVQMVTRQREVVTFLRPGTPLLGFAVD